MPVLTEINQIISLLEAEMPASLLNPKNQRLEGRLQRELSKYFKLLIAAFPYNKVDQLYNKYVTEQLGSETRDILDPILAMLSEELSVNLNGFMVSVYLSASADMITWGTTKGGIPIAYEGPPIQQAISYAERHAAQLVTQMDAETKRRLAQAISEGIKNKRGVPGLARDIRNQFDDMSRRRSVMIARTETNDALSQAFMDRAKDMNIPSKEWVSHDPCEICGGNEGEGVVPIDHTFSSGHIRPPAHPNCRCALAPVIIE